MHTSFTVKLQRIFIAILAISTFSFAQTLNITDENVSYSSLNGYTITIDGITELHLTSSTNPITNCSITFLHYDSWVFFDNVKPADVIANYLDQIKIAGESVVNGSNVRVAQYLNGAIVMPHPPSYKPLKIYDGYNLTGSSKSLGLYTYNKSAQLGTLNDKVSSFILKRGYMATFAQDEDGTGPSKVFIAQDHDIVINVMPDDLDDSVSFIRVFPWRWVTKKGWCGDDPGAYNALNCSWFYNWNINFSSTDNVEYIPMKSKRWWPGFGSINAMENTTAVLAFNEPNNSDQHSDEEGGIIPVDEAIDMWPGFLASGLRVGTPANTDGNRNWLYEFVDKAKELNYRVDFVAIHYYWCYDPGNPTGAANNMYNYLKAVHDRTGLPIWVTEWNNGANWTGCGDPSYAQQAAAINAMVEMMDNAPFVERYSIYNWVEDCRSMISGSYVLTEAGEIYRDNISPQSVPQTEPVGMPGCAFYEFEGDTTDSLYYRNDGGLSNGNTYTTGVVGKAVDFDGVDDFIELPHNMTFAADFTFAGWVNLDSTDNWQRIFDFGKDSSNYMFLTPKSASNTIRFAITTGGYGGEQRLNSTTAMPTGQWTHIAVTLKGGTGKLYVNGNIEATNTSMTLIPYFIDGINNYLGRSQFISDPYFDGKMDEIIFANYALSDSEIAQLANQSQTNFSPGVTTSSFAVSSAIIDNEYKDTLLKYVGDADTTEPLTFSKLSGPQWLTIDQTGTIYGTPDKTDAGTNTFTAKAEDSNGNSCEINFILSVTRAKLIDHYKLNNNITNSQSGTSASSTGSPAYSSGVYSNAIVLDGDEDYLTISDNLLAKDAITVSAWIYWDGGSNWQRIFDFGSSSNNYLMLTPSSGSSTLRLALKTSSSNEQIVETSQLATGQWVHVAASVSESSMKIYVDGELKATNTNSSISLEELITNINFIGKSRFASDPLFDGMIDDIRIYNIDFIDVVYSMLAEGASNYDPWWAGRPLQNQFIIEGNEYNEKLLNFSFDLDGDTPKFSKISGDNWLTVSQSGALTATPTDSNTGSNSFTLGIYDTGDLVRENTFTLFVNDLYDGTHGLTDFAGLATQWMLSDCTDTPACNGGDLNDSSTVDMDDLEIFSENWLGQ